MGRKGKVIHKRFIFSSIPPWCSCYEHSLILLEVILVYLKAMLSSFTCGWRYLRDEASVNEISIEVPGMRASGKLCLGADLAEGFFLVFAFLYRL